MNNLIFDIGMHVGQDTKHYLSQGYDVIAIEANPVLVDKAKEQFRKYVDSGQLKIINTGIAPTEGILPFYRNLRLTEWSSFDKSLGSRNGSQYETIDVVCTSTKKLFEKYGIPYYLKVDIEGYDYLCINDIPDTGDKPKYVSCEATDIELLKTLKQKGYTKFKLISQGDNFIEIDLSKERNRFYPVYQQIKNGIKLRIQKWIPFKHEYGSSGPFGENTKGQWRSFEEVYQLFSTFYNIETGKLLNTRSWFDFHATF